MATAAKSISANPVGAQAGPVVPPGLAEAFAAMIAGAHGDGESGAKAQVDGPSEPSEGADEAIAQAGDTPGPTIDPAVLVPMIDQQRAAAPSATRVTIPAGTPGSTPVAPTLVGGSDMVSIAPATNPTTPSTGPASPADAPVMRPLDGAKPVAGPVSDKAPVMRPLDGGAPAETKAGKPPVMKSLDGAQPAPATPNDKAPVMRRPDGVTPPAPTTDKAPVMRPIESAGPTTAVPAGATAKPDTSPVMRSIDPAATAPAFESVPDRTGASVPGVAPAVKAGHVVRQFVPDDPSAALDTAPVPAGQVKPLEAVVVPAPASATRATNAAAPAAVVPVASEAQPAPARSRTRAAASAPAVSVETSTGGSPAAGPSAAESRAPVQPLHVAAQPAQPLSATGAAPVQNVAAALAQQVLDMSGGDAWIDRIARDISQVAGKDGTMRFRLAPETLGELKIEISHSERGAHVRMNVSTESAQQALAAAETRLTAEARAQGVRIAETEISFTGGQGQGREMGRSAQDQSQHANPQSQPGQSPRAPRSGPAASFNDSAAPSGGRTDRYA